MDYRGMAYRIQRKSFMNRLNDWLSTDEGQPFKDRIDRACMLEEPQQSVAVGDAWDIAEVEFSHTHPELAMRR